MNPLHSSFLVAAALVLLPVKVPAQSSGYYSNYIVSDDSGVFNIALSTTNGQWCYYSLDVTSTADGQISGAGTRSDIAAGPTSIAPGLPVNVVIQPGSQFGGDIVSSTNTYKTVQRKIGKQAVTLSNQLLSEAAFFSVALSDGALIKGAYIFNIDRKQTVRLSKGNLDYRWKTNDTWHSGRAFGSYSNMTGSQDVGE